MYRGTTPTLKIEVEGVEVTDLILDRTMITLKQKEKEVTKSGSDIAVDENENTLSITLTQEETLSFDDGMAQLQVRATLENGAVMASNIVTDSIGHILLDGTI